MEEKQIAVMKALGLTRDEQMALLGYIGFDYKLINHQLRINSDYKNSAEVKLLSNAIKKLPSFVGTLYRYTYIDDESIQNILFETANTHYFIDPAFLSTTKDDVQLEVVERANVKFIINSKNGKDLQGINDDEKEVLFDVNTHFKILNFRLENDMIIIEMEERDDDKKCR